MFIGDSIRRTTDSLRSNEYCDITHSLSPPQVRLLNRRGDNYPDSGGGEAQICAVNNKTDFLWKLYGMNYILPKLKNLIRNIGAPSLKATGC